MAERYTYTQRVVDGVYSARCKIGADASFDAKEYSGVDDERLRFSFHVPETPGLDPDIRERMIYGMELKARAKCKDDSGLLKGPKTLTQEEKDANKVKAKVKRDQAGFAAVKASMSKEQLRAALEELLED